MTVSVLRLHLDAFRSYTRTDVEFAPEGLTVLLGANGSGKTNVLEAVHYLATMGSFRSSANEVLVRLGSERAVLRAEAAADGRRLDLEAEITTTGRGRFLLNKQVVRRRADLSSSWSVSVFAPDDLEIVKGGPAPRRDYLDGLLRQLGARHSQTLDELDRVLRQRNALLRQLAGRLPAEAELTLDVWDAKLAEVATRIADARERLVEGLRPFVAQAYAEISGDAPDGVARLVTLDYRAPWRVTGLAAALQASRVDDVRRGTSTVGPHRDDLACIIGGRQSRTHASQGEQRSLTLALRLGGHRLVTETLGAAPVLLLDDVFSELDAGRSLALLRGLPPGQALLATATAVPEAATVACLLRVEPATADHGSRVHDARSGGEHSTGTSGQQ